jgi:hypothetical protein
VTIVKYNLSVSLLGRRVFAYFLLLTACFALVFVFGNRFPAKAPAREMETFSIETYFNTAWENDSVGGFVWVLDAKNKVIISNNTSSKLAGDLKLHFVGAPCGKPHTVSVIDSGREEKKLSVGINENYNVTIHVQLLRFERRVVEVNVDGSGCVASTADTRAIKVQMRQPVFLVN